MIPTVVSSIYFLWLTLRLSFLPFVFTNSFITYMFCVKMVKAVSEESMPSVGEDRANVRAIKKYFEKIKTIRLHWGSNPESLVP